MNTYKDLNKDALEAYKVHMLHRIFRVFFIVFFFANIPIALLSNRSMENIVIVNGVMGALIVVTLGIAQWIRHGLRSYRHQSIAYMIMGTLFVAGINLVSPDRYFATAMPAVMVVFFILYFTYEFRNILWFTGIVFLMVLYHLISTPYPDIYAGPGYYVTILIALLLTAYAIGEGFVMFRWYESNLYDKVDLLTEKNIELEALNEEYLATEEALHDKFDQVTLMARKLDTIVRATKDGIIEYDIIKESFEISDQALAIVNGTELEHQDIQTFFVELAMKNPELKELWNGLKAGTRDQAEFLVDFESEARRKYLQLTFIRYEQQEKDNGKIIIAVQDVTAEKQYEHRIRQMAYYDGPSGMYSRSGFVEGLGKWLDTGNPDVAVVIFSIDSYKYYTNIFGQKAGDQLMVEIGQSMTELSHVVFAYGRLAKDQFILGVQGCGNVADLVEGFRSLNGHFTHGEQEIELTYTVGIAEYGPKTNPEDLVTNAEAALYRAIDDKSLKTVYYSEQQRFDIERKLILTNAINKELDEERFYLKYQPVICAETDQVCGFESLARWHSKSFGDISPGEFIELAEATGLIHRLDAYLARQAAGFAKRIHESHEISLRVTINVSGRELLRSDYSDVFLQMMKEEQVEGRWLAIEITETYVIDNQEQVEKHLKKLSEAGLKIYLDDFGTGYSSFSYLDRLSIDVLKIDKSLIDNVCQSERTEKNIVTILQMADNFNMKVVAEGVETKEQYKLLKKMGCDYLQGYYFDRPLTEKEALERLINS